MTPVPGVIPASLVGLGVGPIGLALDTRWLMAYAAGLGETDPRYYDTQAAAGPVAHPLFPVCYEWPLALAIRAKAIEDAIAPRGVHVTHHLVIHRPPRAGDRLSTTARIVAVRRHRAGALVVIRFTTADEAGGAVTESDHGSIYRDVGVDGDAHGPPPLPWPGPPSVTRASDGESPASPPSTIRWAETVPVGAHAAHVYTECARIWNPIHTDLAVARAAGLPGPILHGTATLALAVSRVVARDLGGEAGRVRAVAGRFTGMVSLPSAVTVRGLGRGDHAITFDALDAAGSAVLRDGAIAL